MRSSPLALLCLLLPLVAIARPVNEVTTEFFSDQAKSTLVGERILTCGGGISKWGRQTQFSQKSSSSCAPGRSTATSIAASSLLHHDPLLACRMRCGHIALINLGSCTATDNTGPCRQPRDVCLDGCTAILSDPE